MSFERLCGPAAIVPDGLITTASPSLIHPPGLKSARVAKLSGRSSVVSAVAVPVNMIEMPQICHHYPIAFSPDDNATPVALLGLRDNENLFVDSRGGVDRGWLYPGLYPPLPLYLFRTARQ